MRPSMGRYTWRQPYTKLRNEPLYWFRVAFSHITIRET
jgi:hypothetical protein